MSDAFLPKGRVIEACRSCIASIADSRRAVLDAKRQKLVNQANRLERILGLWPWYTPRVYTLENMPSLKAEIDEYVCFLHGAQEQDVKQLLDLALQTPRAQIRVSAKDFARIKSFYSAD